ncbi:MAG: hypothetical protein HY332_13275 [Chloroflexi bacterium]|nr:hypothetical protein [Chloroflexota bacterium]
MAVAVYPRLGELLQERNLTVAELERRIEARFGVAVDRKTLYRLSSSHAVQRADLEIAGAAAVVLGVGLGDLFDVHVTPATGADEPQRAELPPERSRRLAALLDEQDRRRLTRAEQAELRALVAEYGRRLHDYYLHDIARQRGISVEQAHREVQSDYERAVGEWHVFTTDPRWRERVVAQARAGRASDTVDAE